ncbi:O-methyltransferase [Tenggerimyces flavus]|uniref:O-methyltransferase n=1 Tax=Tenggerimyces flavus TaxID=1708749 RepID=A0ABV7YLQ3_9ACTN|nr:class I SAM-dependent methyltransferase [Tenggerimyces flavus]MBM7789358.1 putative O-methyltransferase YrrM [Tenggerimyces flavus]
MSVQVDVAEYVSTHCTPPDELLQELVVRTREATGGAAGMQISPEQGVLMGMLVRLTGAKRAVEVGVFTGYSSLSVARALPSDGTLLACDVSEEWTSIAREFWDRAGVSDKIELRIGPAVDTLRALPAEPTFDFAFIDADKESYPAYYEEILARLVPGGLILLDNAFRGGTVLDPTNDDPGTVAIRGLNDAIREDSRVDTVLLPLRDGIVLARKR